jgi:hypothetical protein
VSSLKLSFDESGAVRWALLTDGSFLAGLRPCVWDAAAGMHVAPSQVDPGGGTAEVFLAFKVPTTSPPAASAALRRTTRTTGCPPGMHFDSELADCQPDLDPAVRRALIDRRPRP